MISSGLSCAVDEVHWQLHGMNNWNREAQVERCKEKQQVVEFLLEKQVEISRAGGVGEGWVSGTSKEAEERGVGGHICANS